MFNTTIRYILFIFCVSILIQSSQCANCFCKKLPKLFTVDCCRGTFGELRTAGDIHCHFDNYINLAAFNRCCDSYYGMGRCTLG
ncbi:unnamed protein product [Cunninghamella blakesleeana]